MTWGWMINAVTVAAYYFTGTEGPYAANDALADLFERWDSPPTTPS
jgi:hypothetical protein